MSKTSKVVLYACDLETTTVELENGVKVWSSAVAPLYDKSDSVKIFTSLYDTLRYFRKLNQNIKIFYHNLKFDGSFWVNWFLSNGYELGINPVTRKMKKTKDLFTGEFNVSISDRGQWYRIGIKTGYGKTIEFFDSAKLLPFSLAKIGEAFETKHQKLDMDYSSHNVEEDIPITEEEKAYIENDVLCLKEALEEMFNRGHDKMTIGSCCMSEFISMIGKKDYEDLFPDLTAVQAPDYTKATHADEYVRRSYNGGWCYLVPEKANKLYKSGGITLDINSNYPYQMHSSSGNQFVYGKPIWGKGKANHVNGKIFFQRIQVAFDVKENKLPFIHVKDSWLYPKNENLTTSDYYSLSLFPI